MRIRDPKTTALIFASGKMVVTGAKSEDDSRLASRKYARIVQKLGFDAKFSELKTQSIAGVAMSSSPFARRDSPTVMDSSALTSLRYVLTLVVYQRTLRVVGWHVSCSPLSSTA